MGNPRRLAFRVTDLTIKTNRLSGRQASVNANNNGHRKLRKIGDGSARAFSTLIKLSDSIVSSLVGRAVALNANWITPPPPIPVGEEKRRHPVLIGKQENTWKRTDDPLGSCLISSPPNFPLPGPPMSLTLQTLAAVVGNINAKLSNPFTVS